MGIKRSSGDKLGIEITFRVLLLIKNNLRTAKSECVSKSPTINEWGRVEDVFEGADYVNLQFLDYERVDIQRDSNRFVSKTFRYYFGRDA